MAVIVENSTISDATDADVAEKTQQLLDNLRLTFDQFETDTEFDAAIRKYGYLYVSNCNVTELSIPVEPAWRQFHTLHVKNCNIGNIVFPSDDSITGYSNKIKYAVLEDSTVGAMVSEHEFVSLKLVNATLRVKCIVSDLVTDRSILQYIGTAQRYYAFNVEGMSKAITEKPIFRMKHAVVLAGFKNCATLR